ncbi:cytochrome P450 [Halorussus gelatinilyticus]|uniref:Cytochrome P450 n=1 Tax=Halorussus gelatinilyticus TaxID=2937524 RepID=A0A8U0IGJ0_9EURY|nr:cytochrome P450 [Halorussus gelatinilyticus]UPV99800.1 cytochrome P450 [Halorussus gelatinilyticus]
MATTPLDAFPPELSDPNDQIRPGNFYARMHEQAPVRWDDARGCWDAFGYEAVRRIASDHERFSSRTDSNPDFVEPDGRSLLRDSMLHADPPRHDRLRSIVDDWFKPSELTELRPFVERRADALLDDALESAAARGNTTFDLVPTFSYPLTVAALAELLDIPSSDRDALLEWTKFSMTASFDVEDAETRRSSLLDYLEAMITDNGERSRAGLPTAVANADGLSLADRRNLLSVVLLGGLSTTHLIDNAVWSIAEADVFDAVRSDADAVGAAVEETLRYRSPVQAASRYAVAEADVGGVTVEQGDKLCVWFAAANRDPAVFDVPGRFDLGRRPTHHVAFGHGTHYCLGAALARLVTTTALDVFLDRFEDVTVHDDRVEPTGSMLLSGPSTLPVTVA